MGFLSKILFALQTVSYLYILFSLFLLFCFIKLSIEYHGIHNFSFFVKKVGFFLSKSELTFIKILSVVVSVVVLLTSSVIHDLLKIEGIRIKTSGRYCYYVVIDGYKFPARVNVSGIAFSEDRHYYLDELYLYGDVIKFDSDNEDKELFIDEYNYVYSDFRCEKEYDVMLLNEHTYCSALKPDTNHITPVSVILFTIKEAVIFIDLWYDKKSFSEVIRQT